MDKYTELRQLYGYDRSIFGFSLIAILDDNDVRGQEADSVLEVVDQWYDRGYDYCDNIFWSMESQVEDPQLKAVYKRLSIILYHKEEAACGML